jgi:hypothetical protein
MGLMERFIRGPYCPTCERKIQEQGGDLKIESVSDSSKDASDEIRSPPRVRKGRLMKAREVPIVKDNPTFVIYDEARLSALEEVRRETEPAKRFEAVVLVTHLWMGQIEVAKDILDQARDSSRFDPRVGEFKKWFGAWSDDAQKGLQEYGDYQHELLAALGDETAQRIADERATPRLRVILDRAEEAVGDRQNQLGIEPEPTTAPSPPRDLARSPSGAVDSESKTCPDCAEEVKAAARVCRFCGYRFDSVAS